MSEKRWLRGKIYPSKGSVFVKIEMNQSKAAFARFGEAVFDLGLEVTSAYMMGKSSGSYAGAMVIVPIEHIDELKSSIAPATTKYQSPTYFNRGSICPIYASPEDEISDICTPDYARFLERNGEVGE